MTPVGRRSRHSRLLLLPLALLALWTARLLWPSPDAPQTTSTSAALRYRGQPTDEPTSRPSEALAAQIQAMRGDVESPPVVEHHPDGSVSADLGRRFLKMSVATVDADGQVHTSCVDARDPHLAQEPHSTDRER